MTPRERLFETLFWTLALAAVGVIGWKFFGSPDQPMEGKIVAVFASFAVSAVLFRWLRRKAGAGGRLDHLTAEAVEWSDTGVSAVALAFLIMAFLLQAFKIPSGSMQPTLQIGDHLFVNKFIYGTQVPFTLKRLWDLKPVRRFDVTVFLCPPKALSEEERNAGVKKDFIKRAVGIPGDVIEIKDKVLFINGKPSGDPYGKFFHQTVYPRMDLWKTREEYQKSWEAGEFASLPAETVRDNFGPVTVPEGGYFVLGDNRDGSFDSRFWGPLPHAYLKGRAWLVYWPFGRFGPIR